MTNAKDWAAWAAHEAASIRFEGQWREVKDFDAEGPAGSYLGRDVVSFASNDYLGLTRHPAVVAAAQDAAARWGTGSGAARLVVGARLPHRQLEEALAGAAGTEAALLFPTGFAANLGLLAALGGPGVLICSDERNHASIVDGCRLARADVAVYRHGDIDHLESLVSRWPGRTMVVTDSVFSMDGDIAPIESLIDLCRRHGSLLVLDEAHAVMGPKVAPRRGLALLRVGTLSKTLGSLGGFVAGDRRLIELLVNRSRPFIFTTAPTPADTAAALAALEVLQSAEGDQLVARLRAHVERVAPGHPSPIVPVVLGAEEAALAAAAELLDRGLLVPAIRPPTVAPGTSRLRVTLSAAHSDEQVDRLVGALTELGLLAGAPT